MSLPRKLSVAVGVTLFLLALTACGPGDLTLPTAEPTETEKPITDITPEPEVVNISGIVIDKDSVYVTETEGGVLVDIPFTLDPATAIAQLSEAIDLEPITTELPVTSCTGGTKTTWGAISFYYPYASAPPGAQFYAQADAKETSNGITVAMLGGQWVGFDGAETLAAYPGAELDFGFPGTQVIAYDIAAGTPESGMDDFYGGIAVIEGGQVKTFSSPIHYYYDC